jgi:hypothetical protein
MVAGPNESNGYFVAGLVGAQNTSRNEVRHPQDGASRRFQKRAFAELSHEVRVNDRNLRSVIFDLTLYTKQTKETKKFVLHPRVTRVNQSLAAP